MKVLRKLIALLCAGSMMVACSACGGGGGGNDGNSSNSSVTSTGDASSGDVSAEEGNDVPVAEGFNMDTALTNADGWEGLVTKNPVMDTTNGFMTFRKKSNLSVGYSTVGMSTGTTQFKMKLNGLASDTMACFVFSNQAKDISQFCYRPEGKSYSLEFSGEDSKVYIKKWIDEEEIVLSGAKNNSSIPAMLGLSFQNIKVEVTETANSVNIKAYCGTTLLADVTDSNNPILGGGAVGFSYTGNGGMVIGGANSNTANYQEPEELSLTIYDQPNVEVATTDVDLLANFADNWTGRERIFNTSIEAGVPGVQFSSLSNPEEPQGGVTEYQGIYTSKLFQTVEYEYEFNVLSQGEWIMFWFKCVPEESTNVSVWGNKSTRENTNGYSMVITNTGFVQVHKWSDFSQIWLNGQGDKLPGATIAKFSNPSETIKVKMSMEQISQGGKDAIEFRIKVGDATTIVVQDTDTPFLNAGYTGVQGFAQGGGNCSIRLTKALAKSELTL